MRDRKGLNMRTTQDEKEILKLKIEQKSIEVFSAKGFDATNMQEIADALGISKGPLYYHFKNKYELYNHVVNVYLYRQFSAYRNIFETDDSVINKFRNDLNLCTKDIMISNKLFLNIESDSLLKPSLERYQEFIQNLFQLKLDSVDRAIEKGEFKDNVNSKLVVNMVFAFVYGISNMMQDEIIKGIYALDNQDVKEMIDNFMATLNDEFVV